MAKPQGTTVVSEFILPDNIKASFGDGQEAKIYFDGSNWIFSLGTGSYSFGNRNFTSIANITGFASNRGSLNAGPGNAWQLNSTQSDSIHVWPDSTNGLSVADGGYVGVLESSPTYPLDARQPSVTAALPVLHLRQDDVDEPFIRMMGVAASADLTRSIVNTADVTTPTLNGYVKVEVRDDGNQIADKDYFIPLYTLA